MVKCISCGKLKQENKFCKVCFDKLQKDGLVIFEHKRDCAFFIESLKQTNGVNVIDFCDKRKRSVSKVQCVTCRYYTKKNQTFK